jgi:hypothetical protein
LGNDSFTFSQMKPLLMGVCLEEILSLQFSIFFQTLNINLNGNSDEKIPVSVLDCDTITQVKQKCITAIYKNKPASEVPTVHELELG